jgi:uncharacterized membrane protein
LSVAKTATRTKFQSLEPITSRPEEQIAARVQERRAAKPARERAPRSKLGIAIVVVATIGFAIAAYTTVVHYAGFGLLACAGASAGHVSSCQQVQSSAYNNVAGIPVSVLGLVGYFVILSGLRFRGELARAAVFGTALVGFLFSMYLTYREAFTLHEYCEWCLGSAACMTVLVVLTATRYLRAQPGS